MEIKVGLFIFTIIIDNSGYGEDTERKIYVAPNMNKELVLELYKSG